MKPVRCEHCVQMELGAEPGHPATAQQGHPWGPRGVLGPLFEHLTVLYFYFIKMHRKRKHGLTINVPETKLELTTCSCHRSGVGVGVFGLNQRSVGQLFNCMGRNSTIWGWTGGWAMGGEARQSVAPWDPRLPTSHQERQQLHRVVSKPGPTCLLWGLVTELETKPLSPAPYLIRGAGIEKLLPSSQGQQRARTLLSCTPFSCLSLHTALLFSVSFITQKTMSSKESLPFPLRVMTDRRLNQFLMLP